MADLQSYFKHPAGRVLSQKVLKEFRWEVNGIVLLPGRVAKTFDGGRVDRVIWKILRETQEETEDVPLVSTRHSAPQFPLHAPTRTGNRPLIMRALRDFLKDSCCRAKNLP